MREREESTGGSMVEALEPRTLFAAAAPDGVLDPSFGTGGKMTYPNFGGVGVGSDGIGALAAQPDGKLIAGGKMAGWVRRYNADGTPDTAFGDAGYAAGFFSGVGEIALLPDGKILSVGGEIGTYPRYYDFAAVRLNPDGTPDTTFGTGEYYEPKGFQRTDFNGRSDAAASVAVLPDGRFVLAGTSTVANGRLSEIAVARYQPDGSLDTTFGTGGKVRLARGYTSQGAEVLLQPDGRLVVAARVDPVVRDLSQQLPVYHYAAVRLNADGTPDPTFGTGGTVMLDAFGEIQDALLLPDGKILLAGYSYAGPGLLARLNADGTPDSAFGRDGLAEVKVGVYNVARRRNGQLLVGGAVYVPTGGLGAFALARVNPDGSADRSFGDDGITLTDINGANDCAWAMATLPDGNVMLGGYAYNNNKQRYDRAMARYLVSDAPLSISGRHVFYNNSKYDGYDPAATAADLAAVATDKRELAPGSVGSFQNVTSYTKGINGLLIDFAGVTPGALAADDFEFRVGVSGDPAAWPLAPAPSAVALVPDPTAANVARYAVTWADGAVKNTWLRVTVKANADTGLVAPDVFYFGNLVGEAAGGDLRVTAADYAAVRMNVGRAALVDSPFNLDRDGRVDAFDLLAARANLDRALPALAAPAVTAAAAAAAAPAATPFADRRVAATSLLARRLVQDVLGS